MFNHVRQMGDGVSDSGTMGWGGGRGGGKEEGMLMEGEREESTNGGEELT